MKRVAILVIIGAMVLGGIYATTKPSTLIIENTEPTVVEKEVQVDALDKAVTDAQAVAQHEIETKAQQAYDEAYAQEMKKVELEVIKDFNTKLDARQVELEKETQVY